MKEGLNCLKLGIKKAVKGYLVSLLVLVSLFIICLIFYPIFCWNFDYSWVLILLKQVLVFQILNGISIGIGIIHGVVSTLDEYDII